ncbi:hypothetical protein IE81DRAFT_321153 [Ceraceosorus guamensis]|uniref:Trypsin-like serine protease n=1 Tax=Ceraceosorus guamensis TaxID=1522189 RepID=A0A316W3S1_9BASI|nr:hypothetical protein IE81DRAFT_321153 [Ceraceosorus guamensis]PWN44536.1 hypothetical protein IE81DRAFT_321153 [Ceraceosorus guamensis]
MSAASASRLSESAAFVRLGAAQARHLHTSLARRAQPVNPSSSVDALLGVSAPAPPRQGEGSGLVVTGNARPNNPNDLSQLLKQHQHQHRSGPADGSRGGQSATRARNAAAMGAVRRSGRFGSSDIPTRNLELDGAFSPPDAPIDPMEEARKSMAKRGEEAVDRETPHPVDAMNGRNELDERVLAAARAVHARGSTDLHVLLHQFEDRAGTQLPIELPYESTPAPERRVRITGADSSEAHLQASHDDGVLLIAYVAGLTGQRGTERISVCSGFAVEGGERLTEAQGGEEKGALVISCAHTLRASLPVPPRSSSSSSGAKSIGDDSVALAITRQGHIFPIRQLLSSLPRSDLVLLQLSDKPILPSILPTDVEASSSSLSAAPTTLRTLPLSPYPATVGTELAVSSFWGYEDDAGAKVPPFAFVQAQSGAGAGSSSLEGPGGATRTQASSVEGSGLTLSTPLPPPKGREAEVVSRERDDAARSRWGRARLVEYKDDYGQEARTGTYDTLAQLDFKLVLSHSNPPALHSSPPTSDSAEERRRATRGVPNFPPPGSSGGPIVCAESGAVVGVTRGTKMGILEGRRGDGVPAEKVFEFFALPGLGKK